MIVERDMAGDIVVESTGHCFFCFNKVPSRNNLQYKSDTSTPSKIIKSIQSLSRFIKMDMSTVLNAETSISPQLLANLENLKLKVELCNECARLADKFSVMHQQLEKIEMEVVSVLNIIQGKLSLQEKSVEKLRNLESNTKTDSTRSEDWIRKMEMFNSLRQEAKHKSFKKLGEIPAPRVMAQNLSHTEVIERQLKLKDRFTFASRDKPNSTSEKRSNAFLEMESVHQISPPENIESSPQSPASVEIEFPQIPTPDEVESPPQSPTSVEIESLTKRPTSDFDDDKTCDSEDPEDNSSPTEDDGDFTEDPDLSTKSSYTIITSTSSESPLPKGPQFVITPAGKFKCASCPSEFKQARIAQIHYKNFHLNLKYKCNICEKLSNSYVSYYHHHKTTHVGLRHMCIVCDKMFIHKRSLEDHKLKTSCGRGEAPTPILKPFICNIPLCGKRFTYSTGLQRHVKAMHLQIVDHECKICGKKFRWTSNLTKHLRNIHSSSRSKND